MPKRRSAPVVWRVTRVLGTSQPELGESDVLSEAPVTLAADAELVVDRAGTRFRMFGPARVGFGADGVCLLAAGTFALTRAGGSPAAAGVPPGPRGPGGRLALPDRVVTASGSATVVGRVHADGSVVEVLSGSARVDPPARVLRAGQRLSARGGALGLTQASGARLDERVTALRAADEGHEGAALRHAARARLLDALGRLEGEKGSLPAAGLDALSRRRALATRAAARIRARAGLADALDAYRAASLRSPEPGDAGLIARTTARLDSEED